MKRLVSVLLAMLLFLGMVSCGGPPQDQGPAGTFTEHAYQNFIYKLYVPSGYSGEQAMPLVVMLHGCTQDAEQFARATRMNKLAEQEGFLVLYPQQSSTQNRRRCWNFFRSVNQVRGAGEPALIIGMLGQVRETHLVDNERIFAAGLSAGGAMTANLAAAYPDVFRAVSIAAGLEYGAASGGISPSAAMEKGGADPVACGQLAYRAMGEHARVVPTLIFQGTADVTVAPVNADQLVTQWLVTNDLADNGAQDGSIRSTPASTRLGQVEGGWPYTVTTYLDGQGQVCVQKYLVSSMGHAWSGGAKGSNYTDPKGPDHSAIMWEFFQSVCVNTPE